MQTMFIDLSLPRIAFTRLAGRVSRRACFAAGSPLHLKTLPEPPLPQADWVRVQNSLCGICGSDLHQIFLDTGLDVAPLALPANKRIYLGHEMVGAVLETGPAVTGFRPGDRVVRWGRANDCRARRRADLCPACRRGHRVLCERASDPWDLRPVGGGFGDSFITPAATLVPVPTDVSDEQAIFIEPAAVALHAASRCAPPPGARVLVFGVGTIGFLLVQALRVFQPDCEITAVAQFPWQAKMAREFGAAHTFLAADDGFAETARLTGARLYEQRGNRMLVGGFDVVFDVVGLESTLNMALRWTRAHGTVVLVGVNLHRMKLDLTPVWYQEVNLVGAVGHDVLTWRGETLSNFDLAIRGMQAGWLHCEPLLTHRFALADYRQAFNVAIDKQTFRSIKVAFDLLPNQQSK